MCTYVRTYVRAYVRTLRPYARTNVRQSPRHISKTVTNLRACARAYFLGPRRPNSSQTCSRKPRHDTKSSNAVADGAKTPPGTPLRAPGRTVIPPGTLPRRLHRCLGNLRTYVRTRKKSAQASPTTPPRTPQKPKIAPKWSGRDQDGPCIAPACSKGRFGVNVGPILGQCLLRLKVFSTSLLSSITHVSTYARGTNVLRTYVRMYVRTYVLRTCACCTYVRITYH